MRFNFSSKILAFVGKDSETLKNKDTADSTSFPSMSNDGFAPMIAFVNPKTISPLSMVFSLLGFVMLVGTSIVNPGEGSFNRIRRPA